jgi:hypothetical protein
MTFDRGLQTGYDGEGNNGRQGTRHIYSGLIACREPLRT